jgi:hypothetical protein
MAEPNRGFLVLADVTGYTAFVTATELEHGPPIVAALLEAVIGRLSPPLDVLGIEGDAVFAIGVDGALSPPASLLDVLQAGFIGFRAKQLELDADDSCACRVCRGVIGLRLKIIGHHGAFLRQAVAGRPQAVGSDVILAHRLLKNGVARHDDYALFTRPAIDSMGIDPVLAGLSPRTERYQHFGEVPCFVMSAPAHPPLPVEAERSVDARAGLA